MDSMADDAARHPTPPSGDASSFGYSRWYIFAVLALTIFLYGLLVLPRSPLNYEHEVDVYFSQLGEGRRARPEPEEIVPLLRHLEEEGSAVHLQWKAGDDASAAVRLTVQAASADAARALAYQFADQLLDRIDGRDSDARSVQQWLAAAENAEEQAWRQLQSGLARHAQQLDETARQLAEFYVTVGDSSALPSSEPSQRPSSQLDERWVAANRDLDRLYDERDQLLRLFPASHPRLRDVSEEIERLRSEWASMDLVVPPPSSQNPAMRTTGESGAEWFVAEESLSRIADFGPDFRELVTRYRESRNEVRRLNAIGLPLSMGGLIGWTVDVGSSSRLRGRLPALFLAAAALATLLTLWIWNLAAPYRLAAPADLTRIAAVPVWATVKLGPPRLTSSLARRRQSARKWMLAAHLMLFVYVASFVLLSSFNRPLTWRIFIDPWI